MKRKLVVTLFALVVIASMLTSSYFVMNGTKLVQAEPEREIGVVVKVITLALDEDMVDKGGAIIGASGRFTVAVYGFYYVGSHYFFKTYHSTSISLAPDHYVENLASVRQTDTTYKSYSRTIEMVVETNSYTYAKTSLSCHVYWDPWWSAMDFDMGVVSLSVTAYVSEIP
ncbi:MAG: hypothetical protein P1Q69_08315 [Candidatus Thorarchaeota archaeon]|nr:hypothetical protein [Candidatus Thorarchaeota archaeon]